MLTTVLFTSRSTPKNICRTQIGLNPGTFSYESLMSIFFWRICGSMDLQLQRMLVDRHRFTGEYFISNDSILSKIPSAKTNQFHGFYVSFTSFKPLTLVLTYNQSTATPPRPSLNRQSSKDILIWLSEIQLFRGLPFFLRARGYEDFWGGTKNFGIF